MCNEYARQIALGKLAEEFSRTRQLPLFGWLGGRIPNDLNGKASVRIRDSAPIFRLQGDNDPTKANPLPSSRIVSRMRVVSPRSRSRSAASAARLRNSKL